MILVKGKMNGNKKLIIIFILPVYLFAWKMESGTINLPATTVGSDTWQTVTLKQSYDTPPLIFAVPSEGGGGYPADESAALRVKDINATHFKIVQVEAQGQDGAHTAMDIHYMAIEQGDYTFPDGTHIITGVHQTSHIVGNRASGTKQWDDVSFPSGFSAAPVVIGMIQGMANEVNTLPGEPSSHWMTSAIRNMDANGFQTTLDMGKTSTNMTGANDEDIAYLAIESSSNGSFFDTSCESVDYEVLTTPNVNNIGWGDQCYNVNFGNAYSTNPNVIGAMQTRLGGDGGWFRRCSIGSGSVGVTVDEDISTGNNRTHPVGEF